MIKTIDSYLSRFFPKLHKFLKMKLGEMRKKYHPRLSKEEFIHILKNDLGIKEGDVLFVHSSMRKLFLDFSKNEIVPILKELVGKEGTLLFPCWQFNTRAEDYIRENEIVFSHRESPSAMGKISDVLRSQPDAFRSFHPTNSVVAIGKRAKELTEGHETDIYPCGKASPLYKMMAYNAKVVGIGVTVDNLTFVHVVEDTTEGVFPLKTREETVYDCTCINQAGEKISVQTLVATKAVSKRDVTAFFNREIPQEICKRITRKGMTFFSGETPQLYEQIKNSAEKGQTIYL